MYSRPKYVGDESTCEKFFMHEETFANIMQFNMHCGHLFHSHFSEKLFTIQNQIQFSYAERIISLLFFSHNQDHHDDIRQEQKWEMQALSSSQSNANGSCHSADDANEHNGLSDASSETGTTEHSCASHMENGSSNQHINNNTIAINNNNCDTIKNNNQTVTAAPLDMVNDVETVPAAVTLIDQQQNALLRSVNIGWFFFHGNIYQLFM